ncbi:histone methyltransferase DOT1 KNAG_0C03070 [Huiozyma naganishii CBS 8797]|uniref:Histone-lysine N-methyltransferase, H3 lysine-79 specific n=1 Tax=Huiozyma naganishii (strain ATCC MYA-139 / BCRC 22969 / CBS 8797 / KCTC 17520 / NBRC 10181 / NCYC 3082 / Yp74L-3) TaxID=1071383 RepID=J7RIR7_HUIN7|nr:hypothetical protein KNAG_0C03070 [Kazachstania naganishii CBS 8797]CCK69418.1 hypothetical protein KNAG_0C03070 [Kazachstania naganishii CBS 8797]
MPLGLDSNGTTGQNKDAVQAAANGTEQKPHNNKKIRGASKELQGLLEDASKYYPAYDCTLPTSYLKSHVQESAEKVDVEVNMYEAVKQPVEQKQEQTDDVKPVKRTKHRRRHNVKRRDTTGHDTSVKETERPMEETVQPMEEIAEPEKGTAEPMEETSEFMEETAEFADETIQSSLTSPTASTEPQNDTTVDTPAGTHAGTHSPEYTPLKNFVDWDGPMLKLEYNLFDIDFLNSTTEFTGEITPSAQLTTADREHRAKTPPIARSRHNTYNAHTGQRILLQSILFPNCTEEYIVDFSKNFDKYDPMSEIGKVVEYSALVFLPQDYAHGLTQDIIPRLNDAYDNADETAFIQTVHDYNTFIRRVPRHRITQHLRELTQIPQSFIHDFLHVVYTRSIHPQAFKLKKYKAFSNYVYGELLPTFLTDVYQRCNLNTNSVFLDLGSGVGNCVIQAALEHGCRTSAGCEIMEDASTLTELQYKELTNRCHFNGLNLKPVQFLLRQSFVDNEAVITLLRDCDVLLVNNFLFDSKLNKVVETLLENAKVGCKIISLKNLRSFGYTIDANNIDGVLNRLKVQKCTFKEDSVSWTHSGGDYYISTVQNCIDESLLQATSRFRRSKRPERYTR